MINTNDWAVALREDGTMCQSANLFLFEFLCVVDFNCWAAIVDQMRTTTKLVVLLTP